MEYTKPTLTFEAQADLLIQRGLKADRHILLFRLHSVNYYRLSAYLYPYRLTDNSYHPGTTLDLIWKHYTFDRQLRVIIMDAVERVEVAVRTQLIYHFAHRCGPFGYTDQKNLPRLPADKHQKWLDEMKAESGRSRETFIDHFNKKYGDQHSHLPLWMLGEIMSFGKMLTLFNGTDDSLRKKIAAEYNISDVVLKSWLGTLNVIRNICAHHGRLWNRELSYKPFIPKANKFPQWHYPVAITNNRVFGILTILRYMLTYVAPTSGWAHRFIKLIHDYPEIHLRSMGFPDNWKDSPIWKT